VSPHFRAPPGTSSRSGSSSGGRRG
jgi:hypothetical protein